MDILECLECIDKQKKYSKLKKSVLRAAIAAGVYHIWSMRNVRLWSNRMETSVHNVQTVKSEISYRIKLIMPKKVNVRDREWIESICGK